MHVQNKFFDIYDAIISNSLYIFTPFFTAVKVSCVVRMDQNFDDYLDFQPKITQPKYFWPKFIVSKIVIGISHEFQFRGFKKSVSKYVN